MNFTISLNQTISVCVSRADPAIYFAANLLRDELLLRAGLEIAVTEFESKSRRSRFDILLCDAESTPMDIENLLDPPPKILPYPDYAEHFHISLLDDYDAPTLVLMAGAPRGLVFAIGYLLQQLRVYDDRIELPELNHTRRPLNPLRGVLFKDAPLPEAALHQHALWGDNCIGAASFTSTQAAQAGERGLKRILWVPAEETIAADCDIVCLQANAGPATALQAAAQIADHAETWLDASTLDEDPLDELLMAPLGRLRALAHDGEDAGLRLLQREMPLTMQMVALCRLHSSPPSELARRRAEAAPLIYAALGVSTREPEWARFVWSALSWAPIRDLTEIFESYGRCYLGAEAAASVRQALERNEHGDEVASTLAGLDGQIPKAMKTLAAPRMKCAAFNPGEKMPDAIQQTKYDQCNVLVYSDAAALGQAAADYAAQRIGAAINAQGQARVIFATGASQFEFLKALVKRPVAWDKVDAFHLDEYLGIADDHPASFRLYLKQRLFDLVNPRTVNLLNGTAGDPDAECKRYSDLLLQDEIDLACIGVGENGHIAFNDPPVADFHDPKMVKVVELDEACRRQQHGEGWFPALDDVPTQALTLTVTAILRSKAISCVVPDERKAPAVKAALTGPVETACPASVLRGHADVKLWLDQPAASLL